MVTMVGQVLEANGGQWLRSTKVVTCDGEGGGDVPPLIVPDDENELTLALVDVAADLFVGLVARAGRAHAAEAAQRVAALPPRAVLAHTKYVLT